MDVNTARCRRFSPAKLQSFRLWFAEFDASVRDRQIEPDISADRLDAQAEEALNDL